MIADLRRYMRWPVYIRSQLIPSTGVVGKGRLSDWRFQYEGESEGEVECTGESESGPNGKD